MEKVLLICDFCKKEKQVLDQSNFSLPIDWYALAYRKGLFCIDDWRITHHFCSLECMKNAIKIYEKDTSSTT